MLCHDGKAEDENVDFDPKWYRVLSNIWWSQSKRGRFQKKWCDGCELIFSDDQLEREFFVVREYLVEPVQWYEWFDRGFDRFPTCRKAMPTAMPATVRRLCSNHSSPACKHPFSFTIFSRPTFHTKQNMQKEQKKAKLFHDTSSVHGVQVLH